MFLEMKKKIIKLLKDIEKEKNVRILFAVESGSRAWGMASENSDYDVRFVFVRPVNKYISVNMPGEVISASFNKEGERVSAEGCFIDVQGFDVHKFTRMLWSSNPTVIEWLMSDILYLGEQNKVFKDFAKKQFKPISLYYHYKSMCRQNYLKYLKSNNLVTYKKYLYSMRGLINAKWIVNYVTLPPIKFPETLSKLKGMKFIDDSILEKLESIIELKKSSKEKDIVKKYNKLDNYIESFLKDDSEAPTLKKLSTVTILDNELKNIILK